MTQFYCKYAHLLYERMQRKACIFTVHCFCNAFPIKHNEWIVESCKTRSEFVAKSLHALNAFTASTDVGQIAKIIITGLLELRSPVSRNK